MSEAGTNTGGAPGRRSDPFGFDVGDLLGGGGRDESDIGWGDRRPSRAEGEAEDLRRFLEDKPPHHL